MSLITPSEVNSISFISPISESMILSDIITYAENRYILPIITAPLSDDIAANPGAYTTLVNVYIKPCLAFYVKYALFNQYITENHLTIDIKNWARRDVLREIFAIAETKKAELLAYLALGYFPLYTKTERKRIAGFAITPAIKPLADSIPSTSPAPVPITDDIQFIFSDIAAAPGQIYQLITFAQYRFDVQSLALQSDSGTISVTIAINGVPVTGLNPATATTTIQNTSATALNMAVPGDLLTLTITALSGTPAQLSGNMRLNRS
jgi:hypothetical protein